jgi:mRNA interferase RelE/StbE
LTGEDQRRVRKALSLLAEDARHPGLRAKRMQGTEKIWEARASRSLRITFEIEEDVILLRNVGHHDRVLGAP